MRPILEVNPAGHSGGGMVESPLKKGPRSPHVGISIFARFVTTIIYIKLGL